MTMRIAIVEDDGHYREAIAALFDLAEGFKAGAQFARADDAIAAARSTPAGAAPWDLVLMDIEMPGTDGIAATAAMKKALPDVPVVMLTAFEEPERIVAAIHAGADGYLLKRSDPSDILEEVRGIAAGGSPLTPSVARTILGLVRSSAPAASPDAPGSWNLSARETEVLRSLMDGRSYKQIADTLCVSIDTVRTHLRHVYRKMQVHSAGEAISRALKSGMI
ncbi:MAG TPA: response regulator transcription factor [Candidatus Polarisedimenticolaceae bacterium]|nr:response regulator transcription factor [Candidatus Polarisedimenticolaceae bacterium]